MTIYEWGGKPFYKDEYIGWLDGEWNIVLDHNQAIVRCKDCQNATPDGRFCYEFGEYDNPANVEPDGFCAWGTKEDE